MTQNPYAPPGAAVYAAPEPEIIAATRWERFRAALADNLLLIVPVVGAALAMSLLVPTDPMLGLGAAVVGFLCFLGVGVWNIVLLVQEGQTLGKKIVGIRIIDAQGENPGFWKIFLVRSLPFAVVGAVLNLAFKTRAASGLVTLIDAAFIFGATRRCLHDILADTHVIQA